VKRRPRTSGNMNRANRKLDPKPSEKIRKKKAPQPTERARRKRQNVEAYRNALSFDDLYRAYAISAASQKWRSIIKPKAKKKKMGCVGRPSTAAFRPDNYDELLNLIPQAHRTKPTAAGQKVVYLPHDRARCSAWTHAKAVSISRHKDSNWIIVRKPLSVDEGDNPYVAIDSTNVFLEPPSHVMTAAFCNVGVYLLFCPDLNKFYVGESNDIAARIEQHRQGRGAKATKGWPSFERLPLLTKRKRSESMRKWEAREWDANRLKYGYKNVRGAGSSQE